jgi:hypothetical protein
MTSSINNPETRNVNLNQRNLSDKDYLKEVLSEEYIKYLILFIITTIIIIGCTIMLSYKINDLESNLLTKIQVMKADTDVKNKDINMVN